MLLGSYHVALSSGRLLWRSVASPPPAWDRGSSNRRRGRPRLACIGSLRRLSLHISYFYLSCYGPPRGCHANARAPGGVVVVSALPVLRARSPCPDNVALRLAGLVEDAHGGHLLLVTPLELCYSVASTLEGNPELRTPGLDTLEVCLADGADGGEIPLQFCRGLKILRRGALLRDDGLLRSGANCGPTLGKRYPPPISASSTTEMASSSTNRSDCE